MTLSELIRLKSFWNFVSMLVAGASGLAYLMGWIGIEWVVAPATFLTAVYTVLAFFDITPELMQKRALLAEKNAQKPAKRAK